MEDWNIRIVREKDVYHWSLKTPDKINLNGATVDIVTVPVSIMKDIIESLAYHISKIQK